MPKTPKQTPKPKAKRTRKPKNTCTALMIVPAQTAQQPKHRITPKYQVAMNAMLRALEETCGNVSKASKMTGVSRRSHQRWMKADTPARRRYARKAMEIFKADLIVEKATGVVSHHLGENNLTAAMFTLNMRGKKQGWSTTPDGATLDADAITKLLDAFQSVLKENPNMSDAERSMWIKDFADSGGVPEETLARKIRVLELTGGSK